MKEDSVARSLFRCGSNESPSECLVCWRDLDFRAVIFISVVFRRDRGGVVCVKEPGERCCEEYSPVPVITPVRGFGAFSEVTGSLIDAWSGCGISAFGRPTKGRRVIALLLWGRRRTLRVGENVPQRGFFVC